MKKIPFCLMALAAGLNSLLAQPVITQQPVNPAVIWGGNATFSVMATDIGPLTYQWQLNGTNLPNNIITTVAGGNLFNNQPATNTILNSPEGVAKDSAGNLFIADYGNHVIRKAGTNGVSTIVAGNGSGSFSGDGGAATNAGLFEPVAVIVDPAGNLFISDNANNRIRKVDTNGIITTVAGNGSISSGATGDNGAATNATINSPGGLCLDKTGNLFIADSQYNRIREVGTNGIITTVAGNGTSGFFHDGSSAITAELAAPFGVFGDSSNNLFIADSSNNRIRKVNPNGIISTVAGTGTAGFSGDGGSATSAKLNDPVAVTMDAARNLFIADFGNHCVRVINSNNIITTMAGNGTNGYSGDRGLATNANLSGPAGVAVDSLGNLFVADHRNNTIRQIATNGIITTVAGGSLSDGDFATNVTLNVVYGTAFDSAGNLYVADLSNNRIRKVDTNGVITTVAGNGIYDYSGDGGAATNASLKNPIGVALDAWGNLFIADQNNFRIRKVDTSGVITTVAGTGSIGFSGDGGSATNAKLSSVTGVAVDAFGNCFISDSLNNRIRKIDTNDIISTVVGTGSLGFSGDGGAATNATIFSPQAIAFDSVGDIFIVDSGNQRIHRLNTNGVISTVAGNGSPAFSGDGGAATNANLRSPQAIGVDSTGNVFIADSQNYRVRKVGINGIITTVAGNGILGFAGDGSSANNASLSSPRGLTMDGLGNVFISDTFNNRIRKLAYVDYADQPFFTLTNVTLDNLSNNYSVIITSASGSVTSSVVMVNLQLPPITPVFTASNGVYTFTWNAVSNLTYQLQFTTNLFTTNWIDLGSPITATNTSVSTTNAVGSDAQRFYRVHLLP